MTRTDSTAERESSLVVDERLKNLEKRVDDAVSENTFEPVALRMFVFQMAGFGPDDISEGYTLIDAVNDGSIA